MQMLYSNIQNKINYIKIYESTNSYAVILMIINIYKYFIIYNTIINITIKDASIFKNVKQLS